MTTQAARRKKLILVVSKRMDGNKKPDRDEHALIRMSAAARKNMGFDDHVEVSSKKSLALDIFHAFTADIKALKASGEYSAEELRRVGFVTQRTFDQITAGTSPKNVWISDTVEEPTTMGADPEFLLFRNDEDRIVHANSVMLKDGLIGCDGAMAEVRPDPAKTSTGLVENIRKIFANKSLTSNIEDFRWIAACYYKNTSRDYPVGGHIHLGNPAKISSLSASNRDLFFGVLNRILDELLAVPMSRLDGTEPGSCRRTKCGMVLGGGQGYGYFGEWRKCDGRLEHRTLSGLWLMHPSIAKAVFGVARAIVDEVYRKVDEHEYDMSYICPDCSSNMFAERGKGSAWKNGYNGWKDLPLLRDMGCTKSSNEMNKLLNTCSAASINKTFLKKWFDLLRSFSTYSDNSNCIRALREILSIPIKEINEFDKQIQNNWLSGNKFIVDF